VNDILNIIRPVLFDIALFAVWLPLLAGADYFFKAPLHIRFLVLHLFFAAVIQAFAFHLWKRGENNLFLEHLYTIEELVMLTLFYSCLLQPMVKRTLFSAVIILFIICGILNSFFFQYINTHNTYIRILESLVIIIWTILYFYKRLDEEPGSHSKQGTGLLLINSGFLLYFSSSLLLFSLSNFMSGSAFKEISKSLWAIHAFVSIILYILIAIGLWKHQKTAI
jgi:hypothetical protein